MRKLLAASLLLLAAGPSPKPAFADLLEAVPFVLPEGAAEALDAGGALSRAEARKYREQASALLGRKTASGVLEFEAPTLPSGTCRMNVFLPKSYTPKSRWPLVIFLHGSWTSCEKAAKLLKPVVDKGEAVVALVDSERARADSFGWNEWPEFGSAVTALRRLCLDYAVDPARVQVWGHSNGAGGNYNVLEAFPSRFSALAAFASVMRPDSQLLVDAIRPVPVFLWQGAKDDNPTSPVGKARSFRDFLLKEGLKVSYVEDPAAKHMPNEAGMLEAWKTLSKAASPRNPKALDYAGYRVEFRKAPGRDVAEADCRHAAVGRHHWVGVERRAQGGGNFVRVRGRIEGNRIELETEGVERLSLHLNDALLDLDKPVTVVLDGKAAFEGRLERRLSTLAAEILELGETESAADAVLELGV